MNVDFSDIDRAIATEPAILKEMAAKESMKTATIVLTVAKAATPRKTGRAQDGWELTVEGDNLVVRNDVPYIGVLNDGDENHTGHHMVEQAIIIATRGK